MSNVFFIIKSKKHLIKSIFDKIAPVAVLYNYLWIGGNNISGYNINQYRGPKNNLRLFKKELNNILKNKKYSIISGNTSFLLKPSEKELQVDNYRKTILDNNDIKYEKILNLNKLTKIIKKLPLTKYGYHLPILLRTLHGDHPVNIEHDIFFTVKNDKIKMYGSNKNSMTQTEAWLKRLNRLL